MEHLYRILVIPHIILGSISLLIGLVSFTAKKGSKLHKITGKVFSFALLVGSMLAIPITFLPGHKNTFLFLIAAFTIYLILIGNRTLAFKHKDQQVEWKDYLISGAMVAFAGYLIVEGILNLGKSLNILNFVFGGISLFLSLKDFQFYRNPRATKTYWLRRHISHIVGAYIASSTAFLITALQENTVAVWITPTVIGSLITTYWIRKIQGKKLLGRF